MLRNKGTATLQLQVGVGARLVIKGNLLKDDAEGPQALCVGIECTARIPFIDIVK